MVAAGSVLTFDVRGTAGGWIPATEDSLRADLIAALGDYFTVQTVTISGQGAFYELMEWQFVARVTVKPRNSYAAIADVESMVAHAVYEATGNLPTVGAVGTQGPLTAPGGIGSGISDAVAAITGEFNFILIAVAVVAVVLIVNVGGKTTRVGLG